MSSNMPTALADGRYQLGQLIGRGGMAEVHVALDTRLGHLPSSCHHERMPSTPTTVVSPVESFRFLLNQVPTIDALVPFTVA